MDRNARPRSPSGSDNEATRFIDTHEKLNPARRPMPEKVQAVSSGKGTFKWQSPKELDPTRGVPKDTFVYISPGNPLCTNSTVIDLVSGSAEISYAGIWQAIKSVPAQVTTSGIVYYNIPVAPLPGATGTPSGTPLKGDLDGADVFWKRWSGADLCG